MILRHLIAGLVGCALSAAAGAVCAAESSPAEDEAHIQRGVELRGQRRDLEALAEFEAANAIRPSPRAQAQVALAHQALGSWVDAERGLALALGAADDPWIKQYRAPLERALGTVRRHLAWLTVETNAPGAELVFEDRSRQALPVSEPMRVPSGSILIEVHALGYAVARRTVTIAPETRLRERVELTPIAPPPSLASLSAMAPRDESPRAVPRPEVRVEGRPLSFDRRTTGTYVLGGAGLLAVAGVGAWRVRAHEIAVYNDNAECVFGGLSRDERCGEHRSRQAAALGFEIGLFAAAGVAALAGTWLVAFRPRPLARANLSCGPWLEGGAICHGEF